MSKFGRRFLLGASILGLTTFGSPAQAQNNKSAHKGRATTEVVAGTYDGYADTLYNVLVSRYGEFNKETAERLAKKSTDAYLRLLDEGKVAQADTLMMTLHENFEKKEVAAARKKAYTIKSSDSDKLKTLKKNTAALYSKYLESQKKFKVLDEQLVARRKSDEENFKKEVAARDSAARADGIDPKTLPQMKFEPSRERLELELRHANNMDELVDTQVELSKNDMILYEQQLKEDKKRTAEAIKKYEEYQKCIDILKKQLAPLQLEKYAPDSLQGKREHDMSVAEDSQNTARSNLAKKDLKERLEAEKKIWEGKQKALLAANEVKSGQELNKKFEQIKADLKEIKKKKEVEIKAFKIDEYKGSDQQKAAEGVKNEKGLGNKTKARPTKTTKTTRTQPSTPSNSSTATPAKAGRAEILAGIRATVAEKKEEFAATSIGEPEVTTFDNNVVQTKYVTVDSDNTLVLEYPNGKAAIIEGDTTTVYNVDGHVNQYIKGANGVVETRDGQEVTDSTVKTATDVLQLLNATGQFRGR